MARRNLVLLALAACARMGVAQDEPERVAPWRADLKFLAEELPRRHKNLFFQLPREEWDEQVAQLERWLPELEDHQIAVELMRLVASVGDGHTAVQLRSLPSLAGKTVPIELRLFSDGLFVTAVAREHAAALGGELVQVGEQAIDEAWSLVAEIVSHDNSAALAASVPGCLINAPLLHALGLAADPQHASYVVRAADGTESRFDLAVGGTLLGMSRAASEAAAPSWLQKTNEPYWFEYQAESRTLYFQFNTCANAPSRPFAPFVQELFAEIDRHDVARVVVDLRHNSGGNSAVIVPVYGGLMARRLTGRGKLYACIGPHTFSSAMMNAVEMRTTLGATLVGEPTGGKPHSYGEILPLTLPHSQLEITYSTKYFELTKDDTPSVNPDVTVAPAFADWKAGRDPVLEAILAGKADQRSP